MKKFNLFNEIIIVEKDSLIQAINSNKTFSIDTLGNISYHPFNNLTALIYKGNYVAPTVSSLMPTQKLDITKALGKNYQIVEDGERLLIKAFSNWQELISINTPLSSYDDTTADGVAEFSDKELENIGWHGDEFNIEYRTLVEVLEEKCEGIVLCIEQEEPYQFSGLGFLSDNKHAREVMFEYCKNVVSDKIANDTDFSKESLTDDEENAAKFFGVL